MGDVSPVFEGAGQKRSRPVDGPVLGRGHHAELTLKLAITRLHDKIKTGELVIKSKDRLPHGADAKDAWMAQVLSGQHDCHFVSTLSPQAAGAGSMCPVEYGGFQCSQHRTHAMSTALIRVPVPLR